MLYLKGIHYFPATSEKEVLAGISFNADKGNPTIFVGKSGSGKTTLIEIISGLIAPTNGCCYWNNIIIVEKQRRNLCGVVFQFPERHFIGLTILEELKIGHRRVSEELQSKVLNQVGLNEINLKQLPENLSGGQQRRLAIAVQLIRKPKVLLLDEPTAGLDWSVRDEIVLLINKLSKEQTVIVATHEPDLFKNHPVDSYQLSTGKLFKDII
ncbi:ABC transporter ATP-binding protein [Prochlorococcus marinus]|uniref:ABC transporter ATP-binding protein n=1 Tax=Prochlorococcus marinus TaxID=1219 RepID=UPI0022B48BCA|nr:ABC transporter ATP-binding protein [Prochlorococcus marinus]